MEDVSNIWTFRFQNYEQSGSTLQFYLRKDRYCISCLSVTIWYSCDNVHYFCSSYLGRIWTPQSSFTIPPRSTTRPLYVCNFDSNHQCTKVNFIFVSFCFQNNLFLALDTDIVSRFFLSLFTATCASGIFNFVTLWWTYESNCNETSK